VKQTQKVEGAVDLFDMPVEIEIATASGRKTSTIQVSQADETFTLPADSAPQMVLFDKGDNILKSLEFKKDAAALIYQLKNAEMVTDRADAAVALGAMKDNADVVAALGNAAQHDSFWGVRAESLKALGKIGGSPAEKQILTALNDPKPWVRQVAAQELGGFTDDASLGPQLTEIATNDKAYRVRAAALNALGDIKAPNAYDVLTAAVKLDSPDDTLRNGALEGLGSLADDRSVPLLLEWSATGKPFDTRGAAIAAVAGLDTKNKTITKTLISYLQEPYIDIKYATLFALSKRGDPEAIAPLEAMLKSGDLSLGAAPYIEMQIDALKAKAAGKPPAGPGTANGAAAGTGGGAGTGAGAGTTVGSGSGAGAGTGQGASSNQPSPSATVSSDNTLDALKKLQQQMDEVNAALAKIESQLSSAKKK
jgi:HEAT repeat protein